MQYGTALSYVVEGGKVKPYFPAANLREQGKNPLAKEQRKWYNSSGIF